MLANRLFPNFVLLYFFVFSLTVSPMGGQTRQTTSSTEKLMPPSQGVAPAIITADSGPEMRGTRNKWSHWHRLGVGKAPEGYRFLRADFWLSGDRSCGTGAQCRPIVQNDKEVIWEYRIEGHKEDVVPRQTYSVAHIRVLYRPE